MFSVSLKIPLLQAQIQKRNKESSILSGAAKK